MQKTIVICLNPFTSHFIPTLMLAKRMKQANYRVIYLGFSDMKAIVRREGFDYISISVCENSQLIKIREEMKFSKLAALYKCIHEEIKELLRTCRADIVMVGISRFSLFFLPAYNIKAKIILYSLYAGVPGFDARKPPNTSGYIPLSKQTWSIIPLLTWIRRFLRIEFGFRSLVSRFYYPWPQLFRLGRREGFRWKFGLDGFYAEHPTIVFGPGYLEFFNDSDGIFAGLCIDETRIYGNEKKEQEFDFGSKPLIYCSLGTMSYRYRKAQALYAALIELFKCKPQWQLLVSLGKHGDTLKETDLTENIKIVDFVQQLDILKQADIMITHGGYGTIKECIYSAVPMLVFPCSYDQHGNASRVQYHKIGVKNNFLKKNILERLTNINIKKITPESVEKLIVEVLYNPQYKENVARMRDKIFHDDEMSKTEKLLINMFL